MSENPRRREWTTKGPDPTVVVDWTIKLTDGSIQVREFQNVYTGNHHMTDDYGDTRTKNLDPKVAENIHKALEAQWQAEDERQRDKEGYRKLSGYELCAAIDYAGAPSVAVVVHNHSTHYLVFVVEERNATEPLMNHMGRLVDTFQYEPAPTDKSLEQWMHGQYEKALNLAVAMALGEESDE